MTSRAHAQATRVGDPSHPIAQKTQVGGPSYSIAPRTRVGGPSQARPFLKWAGGKRQLLPVLRRFYPRTFGTYFEPFLGSGAVFFDLHASGLLDDRRAILTDTNPDIVGCYLAVRDAVTQVIAHLERLAEGHASGGAAHYYEVREARFNPWRQQLFAAAARDANSSPDAPPPYPPELAAMLIYLNRTGYNGLFRLNRRGAFNVPAGRYANPKICDADTLRAVAAALGRPGVSVQHASFDRVAVAAQPGDFLYFDPPYAPLSATARFTSYTADGFDADAQVRLQHVMFDLARRGCRLLLSNSTSPMIHRLYGRRNGDARALGLRAVKVPARRAINSRATRRGEVQEYLITNLPGGRGGL
jgi:DNA adenine methylase